MTEISQQMKDDAVFASSREARKEAPLGRFEKITVRDIAFLAICAAAGLLTSSVMPLVSNVPIYGIIQLVVSLQTSFFFTLGIFKVRKHGALMFMAICYGIIQLFMSPVMFFSGIISAAVIELIFMIPKEGFRNNIVRCASTVLFIPLQMPFLWVYYSLIHRDLPDSYIGNSGGFIFLMVLAVLAVNGLGTLAGNLVGRELKKAGVLEGKENDDKRK